MDGADTQHFGQRPLLSDTRIESLLRAIEAELPDGVGFILIANRLGDPMTNDVGAGFYMSNALRSDTITPLRQAADLLEETLDERPPP